MNYSRFLKSTLGGLAFLALAVSAQADQGITDNEIVIGTHTALSGPVAGWGIEASNGIRMRFEEANEAGGIHGRQIRYIVEDTQYRVPLAVQKANKLINRDRVFALIGSLGTPHNNAVFRTQLPKNIPSLFPYTLGRTMVEPHHKMKFHLTSTYYDQTRAGIKYFVEEKGRKNVCTMAVDTEYGEEIIEGVTDQLNAMNMKEVDRTTHKAEETNFVAAVTKLRDSGCDLVVMGTIIQDTIIAVSTARKMGWNVDMFGPSAAVNSVISQRGGPAMNGLYGVTGLAMVYIEDVSGKGKAFFEKYKEKHGNYPSEVANFGYLAADLTVIALQNAGRNLTVDSFVKGMQAIRGYQHPFKGPEINFGPTQHKGSNESILVWVQDGRWISPTGQRLVLSY
jgi:branched-chain amino acid transport system substrate-binding protein